MEPPPTAEVLVLGAGIAGCALAYHLTLRGVDPVVVYDPQTPAAGASGRAAGILTEQLWNRWDAEVARETHREYADLCRRWDPEAYRQTGFVRFTTQPEWKPAVDEALERLRSWGVDATEPSSADLTRWVPAGRFDDVAAAIYSRHDGCVTPSTITTIYAEGARQRGVTFDFGQPMRSLSHEGSVWSLELPTTTLRARQVVVAAGAWSKALLIELGCPMPLAPYRTQAASLRTSGPTPDECPSVHDLDTDVYVRPEGHGRLLAGDGTEKTEADPNRFVPGGDESFLGHLAESLSGRFPGWKDSQVIAAWAGVCTATIDRRPLVGPVSGAPDIFLITGFNGFGVMRAGGAARRLADLLADGPGSNGAEEALRPVWPGRFSGPVRSFAPRPGFTLEPGDHPRF